MSNGFSRFLARATARVLGRAFVSEVLQVVTADIWGATNTGQDERVTKRLKPKQLYDAYHKKKFVRSIIGINQSFLTAGGGFTIVSEDNKIEALLNKFWQAARTLKDLKRAFKESLLCGDAYLGITGAGFGDRKQPIINKGKGEIGEDTSLVIYGNQQVVEHFDPFLNRAIKYVLSLTISPEKGETKTKAGSYEIILTDDEVIVKEPGARQGSKHTHPYERPPLVHVAEDQLLNEVYGRGVIDEALFSSIEDYEDVLKKAVAWCRYHGAATPIFKGLRNPKEWLDAMLGTIKDGEKNKAWHPGKAMAMGEKGDAKFLESSHGVENFIALLKKLYHQIVVDSRIPEFLFGVHMNAAQASTKEQLVNILSANDERRDTWTVAIQEINRLIQIKYRGKAEPTDVLWGPAEIASMKERAEVVSLLISIRALSKETAMRQFPELIQMVDREIKRIEQEDSAEENAPYTPNDFNIKTTEKLIQLMGQAKRGDEFANKVMKELGIDPGKEAA